MGNGSRTIASIEHRTGQTAQRIITVSYAMQDDLANQGFDSYKVRVCWNGVDAQKYDPSRISPEERSALRERYQIGDDERMLLFDRPAYGGKGSSRTG